MRTHQLRYRHTGNESDDDSTDRHAVWNDEMFEIDECADDQERNKNPVGERHRPRKTLPDGEEKKSCEQFHGKIAKGDLAPAVRAAAAEHEPAGQRQIYVPP